jgi:hypothetical protein
MGRRLMRAYGWQIGMFELDEEEYFGGIGGKTYTVQSWFSTTP